MLLSKQEQKLHKNPVEWLPWPGGHCRTRTQDTTGRPTDEGKDFCLLCSLWLLSAQDSVWHLEHVQVIFTDKLMKAE